ncbi:MAG: serine hydrolase [Pseudomonadota bacterium]
MIWTLIASVGLASSAAATSDAVSEDAALPGGYAAASGDANGFKTIEVRGIAAPEHAVAVTTDTVFHIASLSKQITAAALVMAVLDGKVSLEDPLSLHIEEADRYGRDLTLAHLVYFTSGLTEAYTLPRAGGKPWVNSHYFTVEEAIAASLEVEQLAFPPGSQWQYNNINFQLIAEVVSRAYGVSFSQMVKERIFDPLEMNSSLVNDDITTIIPRRANGVVRRSPEVIAQLASVGVKVAPGRDPVLIRRNAPHYGGGGVMTSLSDWQKWQSEMATGETFGRAFWDMMFATRRFDHPKANDAMGLVHGKIAETPIVWFAGGDIDASSYMVASRETGQWAVCFSNNPELDCRQKARDLFVSASEKHPAKATIPDP